MSKDDARRVGEMIRQLFWESKQRLPKRVVIHTKLKQHPGDTNAILHVTC
jgi:hypothetical protein